MNTVTFEGKVLHLEGELPEIGKKAPDFELTATDLGKVSMSAFAGNTLVLATVPSLDTPVCDLEMRHFNQEASNLSDKVRIVAVSCDLPFAQARWCGDAGASHVQALSDYMDNSFGKSYGVLIRELHLLARAVFVIDGQGILAYSQLVPEITSQPDFAPVIAAINQTLKPQS